MGLQLSNKQTWELGQPYGVRGPILWSLSFPHVPNLSARFQLQTLQQTYLKLLLKLFHLTACQLLNKTSCDDDPPTVQAWLLYNNLVVITFAFSLKIRLNSTVSPAAKLAALNSSPLVAAITSDVGNSTQAA